MAKFKKRFYRRARAVAKSYRSSKKPSISVMDVMLAGAIYGAVRPMVANMLPTFFSFGPIDSDNVILGGAGYMASKSSSKLIKTVGLIAMGTEAGIIANNLVNKQISPSSSNINAYNYSDN